MLEQLPLPLEAPLPPVRFIRHRRARRYILRVDADGSLRVTLPRWGTKRDATSFVEENRVWIAAQQHELASYDGRRGRWHEGSRLLVRGEEVILRVAADARRTIVLLGDEPLVVPAGLEDYREPIERHLRRRAARELPPRLRELAGRHRLTIDRVSVRNQRGRWGSCSPNGTICLNWRLLLMPPPVSDYVMLHELMHLKQPNHSERFWRLVREACPDCEEARQWLRRQGSRLY